MKSNVNTSSSFFNTLYNTKFQEVRVYLGSRFDSLTKNDIEDIYQDTMIDVSNNIIKGKVASDTNWGAYINTIAYRKAISYVKEFNKASIVSYDNDVNSSKEWSKRYQVEATLSSLEAETTERCSNKRVVELMYYVIDTLPSASRDILQGYLQKKRTNVIAEELGYKNASTVKSRKNQLVKQLLPMMEEALEKSEIEILIA